MSGLFSNLDSSVIDELNLRRKIIQQQDDMRGVDIDTKTWMEKSVYIEIIGENNVTIETNNKSINSILDFSSDIVVPQPAITSISIANAGTRGSLTSCEVGFTVFSDSQLFELEPYFLRPAKNVTVKFGWSGINRKHCKKTYNGVIKNFSFTQIENSYGYECTFSLIGKGYYIMSVPVTTTFPSLEITDGDIVTKFGNSLPEYLRALALKELDSTNLNSAAVDDSTLTKNHKNGFVIYSGIDTEKMESANTESGEFFTVEYISLGRLVSVLNDAINTDSKDVVQYNVLDDKRCISFYDANLYSANPRKVMFPDLKNADYNVNSDERNEKLNFYPNGLEQEYQFKKDLNHVWLKNILISIDTIAEIYEKMTNGSEYDGFELEIKTFLTEIFNIIKNSSGDVYKLKLEYDTGTDIYIVDENYLNYDKKYTPYIFKPKHKHSLVRNYSLASDISNLIAKQFYFDSLSASSNKVKTTTDPSNSNDVNQSKSFSTRKNEVINNFSTKVQSVLIESYKKLYKNTKGFVEYLSKLEDYYQQKNELAQNIYGDDMEYNEYSRRSSNAIRAYKDYLSKDTNNRDWEKGTIIPFSLSVTIDGIDGLKFGNTISVDNLPRHYRNENIVFQIINISHDISKADWSTTIETQMRIL